MLRCVTCGCDVGVVEMQGPGVGRGEVNLTAMCPACYRGPSARRLATPERPIAGVEQYDRVPAKGAATPVLACKHGHGTANFQCMRCLGRSRLCNECSMEGVCPHCGQRQPRSVEAFMGALEAGMNDAPLTPAEMGAEARALDDHFGDDIKIRIWGNDERRP